MDGKLQGSHCLFWTNWSTSLSGWSFSRFGEYPLLLLTLLVAEEIQITFIRPPDGFSINGHPNASVPLSKRIGLNAFRCRLLYIPQNFPESKSFFSVFSLIFASCCLQVTELRPVKFGYGSKAFRPSRGWLRVLMRTHLRSAFSFCVNPALYLLTLMLLSGIASYCTAGRSWIKLIVH